jgi:hypothetical protein
MNRNRPDAKLPDGIRHEAIFCLLQCGSGFDSTDCSRINVNNSGGC